MSTACLDETGVRFHAGLGVTGGEDMTFFHDVPRRRRSPAVLHEGDRVRGAERARQTMRYHAYRQLWLGNNMAEINRYTGEWPRRRLFLRGVGGRSGMVRRVRRAWPTDERPRRSVGPRALVRGVGLVLGVAGIRFRHRA